jgi:hypothetical protein
MDVALLRFREDKNLVLRTQPHASKEFEIYSEQIRRSLYSHAVLVSEEIFPDIYRSIVDTKEKLAQDISFEAFIKPDPIPNALCIFHGEQHHAAIILTSALIKLMSIEELKFVIGHELGHFFYDHYLLPNPETAMSEIDFYKRLYLKRCAEISADRVGFMAAPSIEDALRAKLKIASGLPETFFRLNISAYLDQLRKIKNFRYHNDDNFASHPILPLRTRALMWFSMSEPYYQASQDKRVAPISRDSLDDKVSSDLDSITNINVKGMEDKLINNATLWTVLKVLSSGKNLSKKNQQILKEYFGEEKVGKALNLIKSSPGKSHQIIDDKFNAILSDTQKLTGGVSRLTETTNDICSKLDMDLKILDEFINKKI